MKKNLREVMISLTLSIALLSALVASVAPTAEAEVSKVPSINVENTMVAGLDNWGNQ